MVSNHSNILKFISLIRNSFEGSEMVYKEGSCEQFYDILKLLFPNAVPYWSTTEEHVITQIGGKYYDITGEVQLKDHVKFDPNNNEYGIRNNFSLFECVVKCHKCTTLFSLEEDDWLRGKPHLREYITEKIL